MSKFNDLTGKRFGRLVALEIGGKKSNGNYKWKCLCDCGNYRNVVSGSLVRGDTKSCGCLHNELLAAREFRHGFSQHPIYFVWASMVDRCRNKQHKAYHRYGGRGISVCKKWLDSKNFIEDTIKGYEKHVKEFGKVHTTIDRIDNDGNYTPENCRWATRKEQASNRPTCNQFGHTCGNV